MSVKKAILEMKKIKEELDRLNKCYSQKRSYIIGMFTKKNINDLNVKGVQAKVTQSQKIVYNPKKLRKRISKKQFKQIVKPRYSVIDDEAFEQGLKKIKQCLGKQFFEEFRKSYLRQAFIDEQKLNDLFETGEVSLEDLSGCYEIQAGQVRLTLKEKKEKGED